MRTTHCFFFVSALSLVAITIACGSGTTSGGASPTQDASTASDGAISTLEVGVADVAISNDSTTEVASTVDAIAAETDAASSGDDLSIAGPFAVTTSDTTVTASGGTSDSVHLLVPTGTAPAKGWPALAFAHGFELATNDYDQLLTHIASWGYVVASVDYPESFASVSHTDVANAIIATRMALAAGTLSGAPKIDATKIVASGHSLGGKGALMAIIADTSFAAALTFDPVDGNQTPLGDTTDTDHPMLNPTETATITAPVGLFGATQSHCAVSTFGVSEACAPTGLDAATFNSNLTKSAYHALWTVYDFGHMQFLDNPSCALTCTACAAGTSPLPPRLAAIGAISVAYLRKVLASGAPADTYLTGAQHATYLSTQILWDGTSATPACPAS